MGTYYLDPDGNVNTLWTTYDFSNIDKEVRQPTAPSTGTFILGVYYIGNDDRGERQEYSFESMSKLYAEYISSIKVWAYGKYITISGSPTCDCDINISGCNDKNFGFTASWSWKSVEWVSGTNFVQYGVNQSHLDGIQVVCEANIPTSGDSIQIAGLYIEITTATISVTELFFDPASNYNALWGTYTYANIDEGHREPSGAGDGNLVQANDPDDNETQGWNGNGFRTVPEGWQVTAIYVWVRGYITNGGMGYPTNPAVDTNHTGISAKSLSPAQDATESWSSASWTGLTITSQSEITNTIMYGISYSIPSKAHIFWDCVYVRCVMEQISFDTEIDEVNTVPFTDIDEINTIPSENIDELNTVS